MQTNVLDELEWRGLVADATDRDALRAALDADPITFYVGFDPTGPSLHMGHLLQLLVARRLQDAGHRPLVLVGGATGLIGDPKQTGERVLNPKGVVAEWTERIRAQVSRILDLSGAQGEVVNNYDWTHDLNVLDFLRDIGKHFPVNRMLDREAVRARMESGISYTEFSYVLLQSMDYLELFRRHGCVLQTGGSDQWGNITAGVELIRRVEGARVHGLAIPLVTKADGTKFGKTEGGVNYWLDADMTSPYALYQFLLNTDDRDVMQLLRFFTFRPAEELADLEQQLKERPQARAAQRALARDVTTLVHGPEETAAVEAAAVALFGGQGLAELEPRTLHAALKEANLVTVQAGEELPSVVDLLVAAGLAPSRSAARRTVQEGGAYVNNERVADPDHRPGRADLLHGRWLVLRKGRRTMAGVEVAG